MTRDEVIMLLRQQRARGPLPSSVAEVSAFVAELQRKLPLVRVEVPAEAVSPLRAVGIAVEGRVARFPADGDAFDRVCALLGLPPPSGAQSLLASMEAPAEQSLPGFSLPLRIQPARACALGWSSELFSLTVLIGNATLRREDSAVLPREGQGAVAVCAEYERPLTSLDPPSVAGWAFGHARAQGVPMLRLKPGLFRAPLRLETTNPGAKAAQGSGEARAKANRFLAELGDAWKQRIAPALEVAWPVYRRAGGGPLLDAVIGTPLPELELC